VQKRYVKLVQRCVVLVRQVEQLVVLRLLVRLHVAFVKHKRLLRRPERLLVQGEQEVLPVVVAML
jgi:hypothetical protein